MISLDKLIQQGQFYLMFLNGNFKTLVSLNLEIKYLICKRASSNDSSFDMMSARQELFAYYLCDGTDHRGQRIVV